MKYKKSFREDPGINRTLRAEWARVFGKGSPAPDLLQFNEVSISMCTSVLRFTGNLFEHYTQKAIEETALQKC